MLRRLRLSRHLRFLDYPEGWWSEQFRAADAAWLLCKVLGEGARPSYNPYADCYDGGVTLTPDAARRIARIIEQKED